MGEAPLYIRVLPTGERDLDYYRGTSRIRNTHPTRMTLGP